MIWAKEETYLRTEMENLQSERLIKQVKAAYEGLPFYRKKMDDLGLKLDDIKSVYKILGIFEQKPNEFLFNMKEKYLEKLNIDANKVEKQIDQRAEAKKNKDFETADAIRSNLEKDGIILNDTREGTIWDFKALYNFN